MEFVGQGDGALLIQWLRLSRSMLMSSKDHDLKVGIDIALGSITLGSLSYTICIAGSITANPTPCCYITGMLRTSLRLDYNVLQIYGDKIYAENLEQFGPSRTLQLVGTPTIPDSRVLDSLSTQV